ncbi:phospholipase D-like domain-containing protein [Aliikangiella sp. G2MR2-5]|uniref:phospholipase D-like domain-containing protein n=1 Tax=Aliikangiella sp. G2MR2-5 TaxID=2788943 RepID=UPI0018A99169|nr:phospholipase D-like domain-containing protein [Aliikangiella sp. G2MR2-5]
MKLADIEQLLTVSYADYKLSKPEKQAFKTLFDKLQNEPDQLNFVRNKAFELVRDNFIINQEHYLDSLKWLEEIVRLIAQVQNQHETSLNQAYFSPGKAPVKKITSLIKHAKKQIDICVFTISDDNISRTILDAYHRKVQIRIITDNDKAEDLGSDIYHLANKGIAIKVDRSANHMHHKFALIDHKHVISGSFNWTRSATEYNQENIIVSNDRALITQFEQEFMSLWDKCKLL